MAVGLLLGVLSETAITVEASYDDVGVDSQQSGTFLSQYLSPERQSYTVVENNNDITFTLTSVMSDKELLKNPSFNTNTQGWYFWTQGTAKAYGSRDTYEYATGPDGYRIDCSKGFFVLKYLKTSGVF